MYRSTYDERAERRRRWLYRAFAVALGLATITCMGLGGMMLMPGTSLIRLGMTSNFTSAGKAPVDIPVKQLAVSRLIPNRPALSEDVIYVVSDGRALRAFLGTDPNSGCFLSWRDREQVFADSCAQHTYGFNGRNTDQLAAAGSQPANMVELPVQVHDGVLFVEDRILRRDLR